MSISSAAIKRPVSTIMVFAAAMLIGLVSIFIMPVELYPNVALSDVSIVIVVRGGIPPTEVESLVTRPIEEAVATVTHLRQLMSVSKEGESTVVLSFEPGTNMDYAALEVREKFARVKNKLPKEAEKPIIAQFNQNDAPIIILSVTSERRTTESIRKIVDEKLKEQLKKITGVANVEVSGGRERKILVELDKNKIYKNRLSVEFIINKIGANNVDILSGEMRGGLSKYLIRIIGAYKTVDEIKEIPVAITPNGSVMRLKEVATVQDSYLEPTTYARMNIRPVCSIYIQKESTANTILVAQQIEEQVEELRALVPKDIKILVTSNRATFIKTAIANLKKSLFHGILLVILVLYFFMGHLPQTRWAIVGYSAVIVAATVAPAFVITIFFIALLAYISYKEELRPILMVTIAIPISLIITFGIMEMCNVASKNGNKFTINFITMFGMALGVGMLVDSAIVVFENILKKSEQGIERMRAALEGAVEMNTVIIGGTITHVIVFLPMVFVKSEMSMLYSGVAWTVTFSLIISTFVSLAIVPLMASRMRITPGNSEFFLKPVYRAQTKAVFFVMRHGIWVLSLVVLLFGLSLFEYTKLGKEFMGTTEQNKFTVFIELPTGAKLDASNNTVRKVEELLKEVPEVKSFSARVEAWSSKIYVELVSVGERKRSVQEVIDSLRPKTDRVKPAFIYYEEEREVGTKELIIDLFGYDYDTLRELAISMATRMNNIKGFTDTKIRMREGRPELGLKVDKEKGSLYDMTTRTIGDSVHAQMRGLRATMFHTSGSEVEVIARLDEQYRKTFKDVHGLTFVRDDGSRVILDQVAEFKFGLGPSEIWRKNRSRMIQVSANIGSLSLSKAVELVRGGVSDIKFPENYYYRFGGDYESLLKNQREFLYLIIIILTLIYIVLAAVFESYYQPFIIMTTVMTATIGCISGLYFFKVSVGMGALMGMMMLSGIVVNNGIILIDHINVLSRTNKNIRKVLVRVSNERLRPVLMTSVATFIGLVPLAFDTSEGSNLWKPLAVTVIGGLLVSTPLTLLLTPNIYLLFEQVKDLLSGKARSKAKKA